MAVEQSPSPEALCFTSLKNHLVLENESSHLRVGGKWGLRMGTRDSICVFLFFQNLADFVKGRLPNICSPEHSAIAGETQKTLVAKVLGLHRTGADVGGGVTVVG